jgi:hypothetical protein
VVNLGSYDAETVLDLSSHSIVREATSSPKPSERYCTASARIVRANSKY